MIDLTKLEFVEGNMYFNEGSPFKGISIHIGLNAVDPDYYHFEGRLKGCEKDAEYISTLAVGFESIKLLGSEGKATVKDVKGAILESATKLADDGILFISFSGHGGQIRARNEKDGLYETWCLFDEIMSDREFFVLLTTAHFKRTQRILVISDSCHSGTVVGNIPAGSDGLFKDTIDLLSSFLGIENAEINNHPIELIDNGFKVIPKDILKKVYNENKNYYDEKQNNTETSFHNINPTQDYRELVDASVLLISACQDWQLARDGVEHGVFTQALKDVLASGETMNYLKLHQAIWEKLKDSGQNPNYYRIGSPNADFEMQTCFTI